MRLSLPLKLMASYVLVVALIVGPSLWFLRRSLVSSLAEWEASQLEKPALAARDALIDVTSDNLERKARDTARLLGLRVTLIDPSGRVLTDSDVAAAQIPSLESHASRPEVVQALAGQYGHARRISSTLHTELIYGAVPALVGGKPRFIVRLAQRVAPIELAVSHALLAHRVAVGVGLSAAFCLSLVAALFVARPLRRMVDATKAFAQSQWVSIKPVRTGDELEELSLALDALGHKMREHLVEHGAQESLLVQAVTELPLPVAVLRDDLTAACLNGAFRRFVGATAANEPARVALVTQHHRFVIARQQAQQTGASVELALPAPGASDDTLCTLTRLARPNSAPLWLLVARVDDVDEMRGPEAVHRSLRAADRHLDGLWQSQPSLRPWVAELRNRLDDAAFAAGRPVASAVDSVDASRLVGACAEEVGLLFPKVAQPVMDLKSSCLVADSAGLAARAVRRFLSGALRASLAGRALEVTLHVDRAEAKLLCDGAAPFDLREVREIAQALGADAGQGSIHEREVAWLSLPRA